MISPSYVLLFLCMGLGVVFRARHIFPDKSHRVLNLFVIWVSLPALVLSQLPGVFAKYHWSDPGVWILGSMAWIQFALAFFVFRLLFPNSPKAQLGALTLTAGLGNTSFVGLPLLETVIGPQAVPLGVVADQLGSFLTVSFLGISYAAANSESHRGSTLGQRLMKIITFPAFIALLVSLGIVALGLHLPLALSETFQRLGLTLVPLALVSVGMQLNFSGSALKRNRKWVGSGLVFKLVLSPLFFYALYVWGLGQSNLESQVAVLEAAMSPMITAAIVAEDFGYDASICNLMLGIGIPLSLFTVPLWNTILF